MFTRCGDLISRYNSWKHSCKRGGVLLVDVYNQKNHYNHIDHSKNTFVFQVHNL
jgi:hypothetical protein